MRGITEYEGNVTTKVKVNLTAGDWQLFTASMDCTKAARALNQAASKGLSTGNRDDAWRYFYMTANEFANYGAVDTEPRGVFGDLVRRYLR